MRPLTLHASALNDDEYQLFTSSITDLVAPDPPPRDDAEFEKVSLSIRETRAWLRGRYADLNVVDLDQILKLFSPGPGQEATLSGGQFFAILRLVLHVRGGAELERNLVFVQVFPSKSSNKSSAPPAAAPDSAAPRSVPPPPPTTRGRQGSTVITSDVPTSDTNPFHHLADERPQPPIHPDLRATTSSPTIVPLAHSLHHGTNPFITRSKTINVPANQPTDRKIPPLPPRKPPPLLPPRSTSLLIAKNSLSSKPPPPPPQPKVPHLTSSLMKQSLQASKAAQDAKRMEAEREQARVLQVLKSSNVGARDYSESPRNGGSSRTNSSAASLVSSDGKTAALAPRATPALPPRRKASPPPSPTVSSRSLERVASAAIHTRDEIRGGRRLQSSPVRSSSPLRRSLSRSPSRPTMDLPPPPPRHPDHKLAGLGIGGDTPLTSPTSPRIVRSKSMHHNPPPVPPPLRRRRPESVQLPASGNSSPVQPHHSAYPASPGSASFGKVSRHMSFSAKSESGRSDMSEPSPFHKTLSGLGPRFDAARYKAEAGLSRRGYVAHSGAWREEGEERLVPAPALQTSSSEEGLGVDDTDGEDGPFRGGGYGTGGAARTIERDDMKWPSGDGWRLL